MTLEEICALAEAECEKRRKLLEEVAILDGATKHYICIKEK